MPNTQTEIVSNSPRKAKIMASLKTLVNDLTGINPEDIDMHANFLEAGIDSLTLIQATQLVKEQYDVKLSVVQLLEQLSNMDSLAAYIDMELRPEAMAEASKSEAILEPAAVPPAPAVEPVVAAPAIPISSPPPQVSAAVPQPQSLMPHQVTAKAPEFPAFHPRVTDGAGGALDQIMSQQLEVMAQQLEMMRAAYQNGGAAYSQPVEPQPAPPVIEQERPAVDPMPVAQSDVPMSSTASPSTIATVLPAASPASPGPSFVQNQPTFIPYQPIEPGPTGGLTEKQQRHLDDLIARHNERTHESKRLTQEYRPYLADSRS